MTNKWTIVDALRHSRHDWLNRLQLIKANLSLGNVERVQELIDEFVGEAQQEARLMSLGMPLFSELLLTYGWEGFSCHLEYEVLGEIQDLSHFDEALYTWAKSFCATLHSALHVYTENHLCITITCEDEDVCFFFDFRGKLTDKLDLEQWLNQQEESLFRISYSLSQEELSVQLQLKNSKVW
ncbi:Spo0B C-terminal domain-containing protein [Microbacteriaceae bacterium 4G12]